MSILADQFQGGIDPLQNHRDLGFLETRQTRYAARVVDYDQYGRPVVDDAGDLLCNIHWGPSSRAMGAWMAAVPVRGGSPVNFSKGSSTERLQGMVKNEQKASGSVLGRGGGYVKNKDGSISAYLEVGIGLDPGGFDTLRGTGKKDLTFDTPAGWVWGIDKQFAGLGGEYQLVIGGTSSGNINAIDKAALQARDAHRARDAEARKAGRGGSAAGGNGASGPMGAAGDAGSAAFGPGGAFGGSGRVVTGEASSAGGSIRVKPIKDRGYGADESFGAGTINTPDGWPSLVDGSVGIVLGGTEHKSQEPVYVHGDPRMVAVNNGADPAASSVVFDTDSTGGFDFYRKARLHSAWRVLPPFSGSPMFGPGGTLAWQLAAGERDSVAGYGAVIGTSASNGKRPVTTQSPTSTISAGNGSAYAIATSLMDSARASWKKGKYLDAGYDAALSAWAAAQVKAAPKNNGSGLANADAGSRANVVSQIPSLTVGLTAAIAGGPLEVGHGSKDKHNQGKSGEHSINSCHLSTDALFYNDVEADAPLNFEMDYFPEVDSFPLRAKVHLQYNAGVNHNVSFRTLSASGGASNGTRKFKGRWDWWAEVPNTKEGGGETPPPGLTPPDDPPPPTVTPPPTTVAEFRNRITIGGLPTLGFGWGGGFGLGGIGTGGGGGGSGGRGGANSTGGAGTADMPTESPYTATLASAKARGRGGIYQKLDEAESHVRVPGVVNDRIGGGLTTPVAPQSRLDVVRARDGVTERTDQFSGYPAGTAHTVLLFRPQHTSRAYRDLRNAVNAPESIIKRQLADRPITLRAEAFGQEYGETFVRTQAAGRSRFEAGTGAGGLVFLPPELDLLDVDRATYLPTTSTSYLVAHPGVYWASGYARKGSGDVKTGYRWGGSSAGTMSFDQMSAAGVATTVLSLSAAQAVTMTKATVLGGIISPTQIASTQNDYAPTGYATSNVWRLSSDISRDITGIESVGIVSGQQIVILNVGTQDIVLKNLDAGSTAANQFAIGSDYTLSTAGSAVLIRDGTSSKWRRVA